MTFTNINFHHHSNEYKCRNHCLFENNTNNGIPHVKECSIKRNNDKNKIMRKYPCEFKAFSPADVNGQQQQTSTKMRQANVIRRYFRFR